MNKYIIFFLTLTILLFPKNVFAKSFDISTDINYEIEKSGTTKATHEIKITNNEEFIHSPSYKLILDVDGIEEMRVYSGSGESLPFTVNDLENEGKEIKVVFSERTVGKGNSTEFNLEYKTKKIAQRLGETWEINIPGMNTEVFEEFKASVTIPDTFEEASIIKPSKGVTKSGNKYIFSKNAINKSGALLILGEKEYFSLKLSYSLSNNNFFPLRTEIALPPETPYQEVILKDINPAPSNIHLDEDGNYLAEYQLKPGEKKTVNATVLVKTKSPGEYSEELSDQEFKKYTSPEDNWERTKEIQQLAKKLNTPEKIYNYLITEFNYNYSRTASADHRLGANLALKEKNNVVCLEFTDLFVALARAAKIPARSVEGYAYTHNDSTRPLSLVQDVLHAWPEYYNAERRQWVMIDPTWGNTTSGIDYFNTFDISHITFVRKGLDSTYPIPAGGYKDEKEKQVVVNFLSPEEFKKDEKAEFSASQKNILNPLGKTAVIIRIKNTGNSPISNKKITVSNTSDNSVKEFILHHIPPLGEKKIEFILNSSLLTKGTHEIKIQLDDKEFTTTANTGIKQIPLFGLAGGVLFGTVLAFTYQTGRLPISRRK